MTDRINMQQLAALGGLQTRTGSSLRGIAEEAFANLAKVAAKKVKRPYSAPSRPLRAQFVERTALPGEVVFVLPLPPQAISPNGRCHWAAKARVVKAYREQCAALMRAAQVAPFQEQVVIDLEFYLCRVADDKTSFYPRDEDNARGAMKAAQDALKDAGIIPGDGKRHVRIGQTTLYTRAKQHQGFTCVVMTLRKEESK